MNDRILRIHWNDNLKKSIGNLSLIDQVLIENAQPPRVGYFLPRRIVRQRTTYSVSICKRLLV